MPEIDLSLVLACYNEGPVLAGSVERIIEVMDSLRLSYEVIFVDDASRDGTAERVRELVSRHPAKPLRALFHEANRGRGAAVSTGFREARGAVQGYLDVDLEVGPEYILPFYLAVRGGADVAVGLRTYKLKWHSLYRDALSRAYRALVRRLLGIPGYDTECGYKFFKREALNDLLAQTRSAGWFWDTEVMAHASRRGMRITEIPCLFARRFDKASTVRPLRDAWAYWRSLLEFRGRP